jgi:membrane protein required for colicin V production
MVLDSRVGALDRTLGFLFGLGRGLIIVVVAFAFFDWLVPPKGQPTWVTDAKSRVFLVNTADWLRSMSPDLEALYQKYKGNKGDEHEPQDPQSNQRGELDRPDQRSADFGYDRGSRAGMQNLVGSVGTAR